MSHNLMFLDKFITFHKILIKSMMLNNILNNIVCLNFKVLPGTDNLKFKIQIIMAKK